MRPPLTLRSLKAYEKICAQLAEVTKAVKSYELNTLQAEEFDRLSTNFQRLVATKAGIELEFSNREEEAKVLQEVDSWELILHRTELKEDSLLRLYFTFHSKYLPLKAITSLQNPTQKEAS